MKKLAVIIIGILLMTSPGYAIHDVTCYDIIEPGTDYVEDRVEITPTLGVANLGEQAEENFPVIFRSVVVEDGSTHYEDTVWVDDIGPYPDSIEVEFPPWTPEAKCEEDEPWVEYDCYGITELFHDDDENPENDTAYTMVTCLWEHDVGCIDITLDPPPIGDPDIYPAGTEIFITATVENFGIAEETDIPVVCEIIDIVADPDTIVYYAVETIDYIYWRGGVLGIPYTEELEFPTWITPSEHYFVIKCRTDFVGDLCPDDDIEYREVNKYPSINEGLDYDPTYSLEATYIQTEGKTAISFTIPDAQPVTLCIFDVNGCRVQTLAEGRFGAGNHEIDWDAGHVSAGIYFINLEAGAYRTVQRLVITK